VGINERIQALRFWEALDAFATTQEPAVAAAILAAVQDLRARVTDDELVDIIGRGDVDALLQQVDFDGVRYALRDAAQRSAEQTPGGFTAANGQVMGAWPTIIRVRFDTLAPYAVAALRDFESKAVEVIRQDMRAGFVAAIREGVASGVNPIETARRIRDMLGLPDNLVRAVQSYRDALLSGNRSDLRDALDRALRDGRYDRTVLQALANRTPIDPEKAERMVAAYERRALQHNAETLARTGTMDALNQGSRLAWREAIEQQVVQIYELRRFWIVARDERTCPRCLTIPQLNPAGRGMDEPFVTPYDGLVMFPTLHFRCRCVVYTRFDR
jgi:hypothetical protein